MGKIAASRYQKTYTSFSGADITAVVTPVGGKSIVLGELQTISYSVYRPTAPVFALGQIAAKGVVRGARTVAGSLIFTVFDRHVLYEIMSEYNMNNKGKCQINKSDQLPPFDITINFLNEYGQSSRLVIYGVNLISEGQTMSIEDMITENTMEFIALDIDTMIPDAVDERW
ncbi:virion structural protein [Gottfriedia acidiceleris]|uniref:virion structural protein n=1 Tax=Gottfriedia acidiceleris TaxID=371036 RepID=UPI00339121B6